MNNMMKVLIGVIIGIVATWLFLQPVAFNTSNETIHLASQPIDATNGKRLLAQKSGADEHKQADVSFSEEAEPQSKEALQDKIRSLEAVLKSTQTQLDMERQSKKSALSKLEQLAGDDVEIESVDSSEPPKTNQYFEDIPEDYHKLLDPPQRRKDLPELHRDLVDEEQDINWGLAMEQQIRSFVMNHPNSNYLHDFRVVCKTTMCEMMAKMATEHTESWNQLCMDMMQDGWWEFSGTSSSGSNTENGHYYINVRILTRAKDTEKGNAET